MSDRLKRVIHCPNRWQVPGLAWLTALMVAGFAGDACAQSRWHNLEAGDYAVGFRMLEEHDLARNVHSGTDHPRPIRIYLWYPAGPASGQTMRLGRYAELADDDIWPREIVGGLHDRLSYARRPLARSLGPAGLEALLDQPVRAAENADALAGPFPLIVLGQGLYYESPIAHVALCEYLAGRGFVVATAPLAGTHSPLVKVDLEDLETQVRDLEFVIARTRRFSYVSADQLGVLGFDMGGMAGVILAMRNTDVDAFVSMDAGVLFPDPSSIPAASPDHDPLALRIPWLHAIQRVLSTQPSGSQDDSLFDTAVHSERYLLVTDEMEHVDFTSYALVEGRGEVAGWAAWEPRAIELHQTLAQYVWHFFSAFLTQGPESLVFLTQEPERVVPGSTMTIEHRTSVAAPITYAEFVNELITGNPADAVAKVRSLRDTHPSHILLNDTYLRRLTVSLLFTWGLTDEAREVIRLSLELHPNSTWATEALEWLEAHTRG